MEEKEKHVGSETGELVGWLIREAIVPAVCSYGKTDRPKGMMALALKFLIYVMRHVKSTNIFADKHCVIAFSKLLENIDAGLRKDALQLSPAEKQTLNNFLNELSIKISIDAPDLADSLTKTHDSVDQRPTFLPLSVCLLLLIKEDANDTEEYGEAVRRTLIMLLRFCCAHPKMRDTVLMDSEMPLLLVAKLSYYFVSIPQKIPLLKMNGEKDQP